MHYTTIQPKLISYRNEMKFPGGGWVGGRNQLLNACVCSQKRGLPVISDLLIH
jgi:hypothetical protein